MLHIRFEWGKPETGYIIGIVNLEDQQRDAVAFGPAMDCIGRGMSVHDLDCLGDSATTKKPEVRSDTLRDTLQLRVVHTFH